MRDRSKRSPFIRFAVEESDDSVFVMAYTNTRDIRIRFDEGGFIPAGVFRYVMRVMDNPSIVQRDDPKTRRIGSGKYMFQRGPVTIVAKDLDGYTEMDVTIRLPDGSGDVRKVLTYKVCDELCERLSQIDALLFTYFKHDQSERPADKAGANGKAQAVPGNGAAVQ